MTVTDFLERNSSALLVIYTFIIFVANTIKVVSIIFPPFSSFWWLYIASFTTFLLVLYIICDQIKKNMKIIDKSMDLLFGTIIFLGNMISILFILELGLITTLALAFIVTLVLCISYYGKSFHWLLKVSSVELYDGTVICGFINIPHFNDKRNRDVILYNHQMINGIWEKNEIRIHKWNIRELCLYDLSKRYRYKRVMSNGEKKIRDWFDQYKRMRKYTSI